MTIETMEAVFEEICQTKQKPDVVIVDYLGLLSHNEQDMSDWLQLNYLSEKLHEFGRVHDVVMLSASQLNSGDDKKTSAQNISLSRISRSKLIAANCNFVMMIEKRQDEHKHQNMLVHLIKSRRTQLVSGMLFKKLETCTILDSPTQEFEEGSVFSEMNNIDSDLSDLIE